MSKFIRKGLGSTHNRRRLGRAGTQVVLGNDQWAVPSLDSSVFIGPSVEGTDKEYVKVISGKVIDRKPSFA